MLRVCIPLLLAAAPLLYADHIELTFSATNTVLQGTNQPFRHQLDIATAFFLTDGSCTLCALNESFGNITVPDGILLLMIGTPVAPCAFICLGNDPGIDPQSDYARAWATMNFSTRGHATYDPAANTFQLAGTSQGWDIISISPLGTYYAANGTLTEAGSVSLHTAPEPSSIFLLLFIAVASLLWCRRRKLRPTS